MNEKVKHMFLKYVSILSICLNIIYRVLLLDIILQRIAQSLREGGPQELKLERYMEAVSERDVQLSYHALIRSRKQSVPDAEQLFGSRILSFFE